MLDYLIHFFTNNKIYLFTGLALLLLIVLPTRGKISSKTRTWLYLSVILWIICFSYRVNTGNDIISLFKKSDNFDDESKPVHVRGGPFNKYYSNDAGRRPKTTNQ